MKLHNINFTLNQIHHTCTNPSVAMTTTSMLTDTGAALNQLSLSLCHTWINFICCPHIQKTLNDEILLLSKRCAVVAGHRTKSHIYTTGCHLLNVTNSSMKQHFICIFHKALYCILTVTNHCANSNHMQYPITVQLFQEVFWGTKKHELLQQENVSKG
jgi:hypothetical protein